MLRLGAGGRIWLPGRSPWPSHATRPTESGGFRLIRGGRYQVRHGSGRLPRWHSTTTAESFDRRGPRAGAKGNRAIACAILMRHRTLVRVSIAIRPGFQATHRTRGHLPRPTRGQAPSVWKGRTVRVLTYPGTCWAAWGILERNCWDTPSPICCAWEPSHLTPAGLPFRPRFKERPSTGHDIGDTGSSRVSACPLAGRLLRWVAK